LNMKSKTNKSSETFAEFTISRIDPAVRATLTDVQRDAIRQALMADSGDRRHSLDLRFTVPLYFVHYYFLILGGRDRRRSTSFKEGSRLEKTPWSLRRLVAVSVYVALAGAFLYVMFMGLYVLKREMGIDIFPGIHLKNLMHVPV
jgi:hypothetical protein